MQNLELECAKLAERLAKGAEKEREDLLTDAIGVLQEQGLYAFFLYLKSQKKQATKLAEDCARFLRHHKLLDKSSKDLFAGLKKLAKNLDTLLFSRELLLQALVYARYHAKANQEGKG